jgi:hypothetical protein
MEEMYRAAPSEEVNQEFVEQIEQAAAEVYCP